MGVPVSTTVREGKAIRYMSLFTNVSRLDFDKEKISFIIYLASGAIWIKIVRNVLLLVGSVFGESVYFRFGGLLMAPSQKSSLSSSVFSLRIQAC